MRTHPRFHIERERQGLRLRVVGYAFLSLLLLIGLRGTPAGAECQPGSGRAGPVPPPEPPPEEEPPPPPPPPPVTDNKPPKDEPTEEPEDPEPEENPKPGGPPVTDTGEPPPPEDDGEDPVTEPPTEVDPPPTPPKGPDIPTAPTTGGDAPTPTVGGTRRARPKSAADSIEWRWNTWWTFNRWNYLPLRNEVVKRNFARFHVVTGEGAGKTDLWTERRDKLARMRAAPALLRVMRADLSPGDIGIKAAASIGLARVSNRPEAVASVLAVLEDPKMTHEVRESAAFAAGMFRRTDPELQMEGARVDELRKRLFALADNEKTPRKVQCIAIMSVGLLGDQPRAIALPPGVMETRALWRRLMKADRGSELHIAYLTALGMQPDSAAADAVLEGLRDIAIGKRVGKRSWSTRERSHALCTLVRLGGRSRNAAVKRLMTDRRLGTPVRRAAFITLGEGAEEYSAAERKSLVRDWTIAIKQARDPLTRGLGLIALGRIVAADLNSDEDAGRILRTTDAGDILLKEARTAASNMRGFAILALAIAMRDAEVEDRSVVRFRSDAEELIRKGLQKTEGNAASRAPYVVAIGLGRLTDALPTLEELVKDSNEDPQLRAYAAVACGQIGRASPTAVHALKRAVADYKLGNLRIEAALGLAYLTGDRDAKLLREDIERRRYTHSHRIGHVAIALGQMGDLKAILPLSQLLLDNESDHGARGAAAVALGLLCDPEKIPSQSRLWEDVNYPARSAALHAALNFY